MGDRKSRDQMGSGPNPSQPSGGANAPHPHTVPSALALSQRPPRVNLKRELLLPLTNEYGNE